MSFIEPLDFICIDFDTRDAQVTAIHTSQISLKVHQKRQGIGEQILAKFWNVFGKNMKGFRNAALQTPSFWSDTILQISVRNKHMKGNNVASSRRTVEGSETNNIFCFARTDNGFCLLFSGFKQQIGHSVSPTSVRFDWSMTWSSLCCVCDLAWWEKNKNWESNTKKFNVRLKKATLSKRWQLPIYTNNCTMLEFCEHHTNECMMGGNTDGLKWFQSVCVATIH